MLLYVDDNEADYILMKRRFGVKGATLINAPTIEEAVKAFSPEVHKLALLDWNLPDGQGTEVADHITKNNSNFPIIFVSTTFNEDMRRVASSYAPLNCIEKSIENSYFQKILSIYNQIR